MVFKKIDYTCTYTHVQTLNRVFWASWGASTPIWTQTVKSFLKPLAFWTQTSHPTSLASSSGFQNLIPSFVFSLLYFPPNFSIALSSPTISPVSLSLACTHSLRLNYEEATHLSQTRNPPQKPPQVPPTRCSCSDPGQQVDLSLRTPIYTVRSSLTASISTTSAIRCRRSANSRFSLLPWKESGRTDLSPEEEAIRFQVCVVGAVVS